MQRKEKIVLRILFLVVVIIILAALASEMIMKNMSRPQPGAAEVNVSITEREAFVLPSVSHRIPEFFETYTFEDSTTNDLASEDFDKDGYPELFVGNFDANNYLFLNNKNKTFTPIDPFGISKTTSVAISDFDNDGDFDIAIGNYGDINFLFVDSGNLNFKKREEFMETRTKDNKVNKMVWGDFNNDGYKDLAAIRNNQQSYLFINNKDGSFIASRQFEIGNFNDAAWADFDSDGFIDLLVAGYNQQSHIYYNSRTWRAKLFDKINFGNISKIRSIDVADFNLDGLPDVAVANYGQQNYIYLNKGNRTFIRMDAFGKGNSVDIVSADLNNDGWQDAIVANYNEMSYIYYNNGCNFDNCSFTEAPFTYGYTHTFAVADYDKDGDLDIAVGRYTDKTTLFENLLIR